MATAALARQQSAVRYAAHFELSYGALPDGYVLCDRVALSRRSADRQAARGGKCGGPDGSGGNLENAPALEMNGPPILMPKQKTKHELTWIGKENRPRLEARKAIRALEVTRNKKRRELVDAQDRIDEQPDRLIGKIEQQLKQRQSVQPLFVVRWRLG